MGRGSSGLKGSSKGGGAPSTPSGVNMAQFQAMTPQQKIQTINNILADTNIQVPPYLDGSDTSKVLWALGMDNKPNVVSDSALDSMQGIEIFRTVYDTSSPPPYAQDIWDQIRTGDYTQLSGKGGSAHGRALYFATNFGDSAVYGQGEVNPLISRSKINPSAKIMTERKLQSLISSDPLSSSINARNWADRQALYALHLGLDGWSSGTYTMIINRGILSMSDTNKAITSSVRMKKNGQPYKRQPRVRGNLVKSWSSAITMP